MKFFLQRSILFLFLVPVFFIAHAYAAYTYHLSAGDIAGLFIKVSAVSLAVFLLIRIFVKDNASAAVPAFLFMNFFLYCAAFFFWFKSRFPGMFFSRISFLSLLVTAVIILAGYLFAKAGNNRKGKIILYLNTLMLILVLTDTGIIIYRRIFQPAPQMLSPLMVKDQKAKYRPDVFFILMDEYPSGTALKENLHFDNTEMESYLISKGFSLQRNSRSNYNYTVFSMASMLNMSYLLSLPRNRVISEHQYLDCVDLIHANRVDSLFTSAGYTFINHTYFEMQGKPSLLPVPMFGSARHNIENWTFYKRVIYPLTDRQDNPLYNYNEEVFKRLLAEARSKTGAPRFVYAHFLLPHNPFNFDSSGRKMPEPVRNEGSQYRYFLYNLAHANKKLKQIVDTLSVHRSDAVIIILADHGYRKRVYTEDKKVLFSNLSAIYFPDKDYSVIYDSITPVNIFRTVANKIFSTSYPLLKDTSILLKEKGSNDPL